MYHANHDTTPTTFDRISYAINDSRPVQGLAAVVIFVAMGAIAWLLMPVGPQAGPQPAITDPITGASEVLDPAGDGATTGGSPADGGAVPGGTADTPTGSGGDGSEEPDDPDPANDPTPNDPQQPGPGPGRPANQPPILSDVTVEATGMTVVVQYRIDDLDGDEIASSVSFGDGPTTTTDLPDLPQQGALRADADGTGGDVPTPDPGRPPRLDLFEVIDGVLVPVETDGSEDHGPKPLADGFYEARYTYDRNEVGTTHTAGIVILVEDVHGATARQAVAVELTAIDRYTVSNIDFRFRDRGCFVDHPARRLFGNIDLRGAIHSTNALDEELRADRPGATILTGRAADADAGTGLTVSFQPAVEWLQLTNHVEQHMESATVQADVGSGTCAGVLTYQVTVEQL